MARSFFSEKDPLHNNFFSQKGYGTFKEIRRSVEEEEDCNLVAAEHKLLIKDASAFHDKKLHEMANDLDSIENDRKELKNYGDEITEASKAGIVNIITENVPAELKTIADKAAALNTTIHKYLNQNDPFDKLKAQINDLKKNLQTAQKIDAKVTITYYKYQNLLDQRLQKIEKKHGEVKQALQGLVSHLSGVAKYRFLSDQKIAKFFYQNAVRALDDLNVCIEKFTKDGAVKRDFIKGN